MWQPKEQRVSMLEGWAFRTNLKGKLSNDEIPKEAAWN
jgi:hypothetical protein